MTRDGIIVGQSGEREVQIMRPQGGLVTFSHQETGYNFNGSRVSVVDEAGNPVPSLFKNGSLMVYSRSIARAFDFIIESEDADKSIVYLV